MTADRIADQVMVVVVPCLAGWWGDEPVLLALVPAPDWRRAPLYQLVRTRENIR
jgi:hypothetical protein